MDKKIEHIIEYASHYMVSRGKTMLLTIAFNPENRMWEAGYVDYKNENHLDNGFFPAAGKSFTSAIMNFAKIFAIPEVRTWCEDETDSFERLEKSVQKLPKTIKGKDGTLYHLRFTASEPGKVRDGKDWAAGYYHEDEDDSYYYDIGTGASLRDAAIDLLKKKLGGNNMLSLKNIKYSKELSQETLCFTASVYWKGKKIGNAMNGGHGGPSQIVFNLTGTKEQTEAIRKWCKEPPRAIMKCWLIAWKTISICSWVIG